MRINIGFLISIVVLIISLIVAGRICLSFYVEQRKPKNQCLHGNRLGDCDSCYQNILKLLDREIQKGINGEKCARILSRNC